MRMVTASRRILHLADPAWPGGGPCALRMLAGAMRRLTHDRHVAVVLGNRGDLELARRCGVAAVGSVPVPAGLAPLARRTMGRVVRALEADGGSFSIVHAWSPRAALLCDAAPNAHAVATMTVAPVEGLHAELLGAALAARPMPLLASTVSVRRELLAVGVSADVVPILPPGVDRAAETSHGETSHREIGHGEIGHGEVGYRATGHDGTADGGDSPTSFALARRRLRRRWGVDDATFVMGLVGDPVAWSDARAAVFLLTLLRIAGHRAHLVMHPRANRGDHMLRWSTPMRIDRDVTLDAVVALPWEAAPGLDVALLFGDETTSVAPRPLSSPLSFIFGGGRPSRPMPGVLPLLWTGAAGVPALAESSLAACGVIEEGITGLLVEPRRIAAAAQRLTALLADPQTRARLGQAARDRIGQTHSLSAMTVRLRDVYDCLAERRPVPVRLAGMPADDGDDDAIRWRPAPDATPRALVPRPAMSRPEHRAAERDQA